MYRPEGMEETLGHTINKCHTDHDELCETCLVELFEAGADAMSEVRDLELV